MYNGQSVKNGGAIVLPSRLLAHSCWRRPTQIPDNTCFCNVEEEELKGEESEHTDLLGFLLEQLELDPEVRS